MRQLLFENKFFFFVTILLSLSGCEKKNNTLIDSVGNAPVVSDASYSNSIINTDTILVEGHTERNPDDTITITGIAKVKVDASISAMNISFVGYSVTNYNFSSSLAEGSLHDDGVFPDTRANDGIYSGYIEFQIQRYVVGEFSINLWSEGTTGYKSSTIILPVKIVRLNRPPIISNLSAPDTIRISYQTSFTISVKVIDPDGYQDIKSVLRYTPSGKVLPLSPYNDSIYVETVSLVPPPALGSYNFRFLAFDKSNDSSNVLFKMIVISN